MRRASSSCDGQQWQFRSDSVRETTYQTLTKASRAQRHAGVAASIAAHSPTALDDLAHHTATAAELVADLGHGRRACRSGIRADAITVSHRRRRAGSRHRQPAAARAAHHPRDGAARGARPTRSTGCTRLALLRCSGLIETAQLRRRAATSTVRCSPRPSIATTSQTEGAARRLLGTLHHLHGDQANARIELGLGVELLRTTDGDRAAGRRAAPAWLHRAVRRIAGRRRVVLRRGRGRVHRSWPTSAASPTSSSTAPGCRSCRAISALADERLHSAADTLNRLGDRNGVGWAFGLLAFVRFFQRRFVEAEDLASVVGAEAFDRGDEWAAAMMQTLLADLRLWQGNLTEALGNAEQARNRFKRIGDKFGMVQSLSALVRIQVALGRSSALHRSIEELLSLADNSQLGPVPVLAVAGAAMHRGDGQMALTTVERGLDAVESQTAGAFEAMVVRTIAFAQVGRIDEALTALDAIAPESMELPFAQVGAALVASLSGDADGALAAADMVSATPGAVVPRSGDRGRRGGGGPQLARRSFGRPDGDRRGVRANVSRWAMWSRSRCCSAPIATCSASRTSPAPATSRHWARVG